jgi:hypothetical protein
MPGSGYASATPAVTSSKALSTATPTHTSHPRRAGRSARLRRMFGRRVVTVVEHADRR